MEKLGGEMQKEPLKIGFIGGGINSVVGNTHKIASQMDNRWKLVAGCFSRENEVNLKTAEEWGIDKNRVYNDWHKFLESEKENLDAVVIITPTNIHTEMIIEALNAGYAVISEKAMTNRVEDAEKIVEVAKKNSSFMAVTYNYTGYPIVRELKNIIDKGELGKIWQIQIEMPQEGFARLDAKGNKPKPQEWRLVDEEIPTISLDLGVHIHSIIDFLTGEKPLEVIADNRSFGHFSNVCDNVNCIANFTGDLQIQMWYSKSALGNRNGLRLRVYGEKGSAEWFQMQPEELLLADIYGNRKIIDRAEDVKIANETRYNRFKAGHPAGFIEAFANYYFDLADDLLEFKNTGKVKNKFIFGPETARKGLKMLRAMAKSNDTRKWEIV